MQGGSLKIFSPVFRRQPEQSFGKAIRLPGKVPHFSPYSRAG